MHMLSSVTEAVGACADEVDGFGNACEQPQSRIHNRCLRATIIYFMYKTCNPWMFASLVSDFMDDANMPSLLSLPIYGYLNQTDEIYARTRAAVLSSRNPWSSNGTAGAGVGSPHTGAHAACERRLPQGCLAQQDGYACERLLSSRCAAISRRRASQGCVRSGRSRSPPRGGRPRRMPRCRRH